jgi:hypothetical protein
LTRKNRLNTLVGPTCSPGCGALTSDVVTGTSRVPPTRPQHTARPRYRQLDRLQRSDGRTTSERITSPPTGEAARRTGSSRQRVRSLALTAVPTPCPGTARSNGAGRDPSGSATLRRPVTRIREEVRCWLRHPRRGLAFAWRAGRSPRGPGSGPSRGPGTRRHAGRRTGRRSPGPRRSP